MTAPSPNGSPINTAAVGTFPFTVSARNADGATLTTSVANYQVTETGQPTDPGGSVPATLNLNLGTPTAFTAFVPGVAKDYTSTLTAQILSTAGDAKLTVADASDTNVGKMVNGTYALPQTVQVGAQKVVVPETGPNTLDPTAPAFKPLTGMSAPTKLLTYGGPVSGSADRHLQAGHRRDGRAPHRLLREDADLHALDDEPVVDRA